MWSVCTCLGFGLLNLYCLSLTLSASRQKDNILQQPPGVQARVQLWSHSSKYWSGKQHCIYIQGLWRPHLMWFPHLSPKLDEQMPSLPPPSSAAVAALVKELRSQLGMALFGVDVIINIHTHTLTVIDINIFPGSTFMWTHKQTVNASMIHLSVLHQATKVCLSFSPPCSITSSQCWKSRTLLAFSLLGLQNHRR